MRVPRPLLLVDFDGVLNPFAAAECPEGFTEYALDDFPGDDPVRLNPVHARWLDDLSARYDLAWASACPQDLNACCGRLVQLAPMPRVPMPAPPFPADVKVEHVAAFAGERAVAWIDDAFGDTARRWARERRAPTLLVDADPAIGLTVAIVETVAAWPDSLEMP